MIFVFDLDDTVCETDSYSEEYISKFFKDNNLPYKQVLKTTRFAEKKFDWDNETALSWYKEYGDEMMLNFPCKANSIETINKLHDLGHKIIIATARANDWHSDPEGITLKWLKINGIKYDKIYIGRIDKEAICEEENADIFIDDDTKITKKVSEYFSTCDISNKKSFLMTTDYNSNLEVPESVERIVDFNDFVIKLKKYGINL